MEWSEYYGELPYLGVADDFSLWYAELEDIAPTCPVCLTPAFVTPHGSGEMIDIKCYADAVTLGRGMMPEQQPWSELHGPG